MPTVFQSSCSWGRRRSATAIVHKDFIKRQLSHTTSLLTYKDASPWSRIYCMRTQIKWKAKSGAVACASRQACGTVRISEILISASLLRAYDEAVRNTVTEGLDKMDLIRPDDWYTYHISPIHWKASSCISFVHVIEMFDLKSCMYDCSIKPALASNPAAREIHGMVGHNQRRHSWVSSTYVTNTSMPLYNFKFHDITWNYPMYISLERTG
jgi:hypothetical protein